VVLAAVDRLLDEDTRLDAQDPRGFGPLHLTALHGLLRLARHLLRAGCDPDLRDALNRTPREVAVMRGFVDVAAEFAPAPGVSMARFLRDRGGPPRPRGRSAAAGRARRADPAAAALAVVDRIDRRHEHPGLAVGAVALGQLDRAP